MGGKISTVTHALVRATLEVPVLVEDDLKKSELFFHCFIFISIKLNSCQLHFIDLIVVKMKFTLPIMVALADSQ